MNRFCSNCGAQRAGDAAFCSSCGRRFDSYASAPPAPAAQTAEAPKAPIGFHWGYAACAVLLALIGLIVVSNTAGVWLAAGAAMLAVPALGLLLSAGFRNVEGAGPAGGLVVKLPAYLLLGVFMLVAAALSSYFHRQVSDEH